MSENTALDDDPLQENFELRMKAFYRLEQVYLSDDYLRKKRFQIIAGVPPQPLHPSQCQSTLQLWRLTIGEWVFRVVDHYGFVRETAGVCLNFIDRCVCAIAKKSEHPELTMREYQLLSTGCLYLSLKVSVPEPSSVSHDLMARISRGLFSAQQIVEMESNILKMLKWRLRPPTTHVFLHYFCTLLSTDLRWAKVIEDARFSAELALLDYDASLKRPSHLALAALLNAMEDNMGNLFSQAECQLYDGKLRQQTFLNNGEEDETCIRFCRDRMREMHRQRAIRTEQAPGSVIYERPSSPNSVFVDFYTSGG